MWIIFARPHPRFGLHDTRRASFRRDRGFRRHRGAPPPGRAGAEGLGPGAPLRRLRRPRRDRGPRLRRAAPQGLVRLDHGRGDAARGAARHAGARARARCRGDREARATARASRPSRCPTTSMRACAPRASKARRRMCWAIIPNGSMRNFAATFGDERAEEGAALASRAPLDLRVNTLKATRAQAAEELAELSAQPTRWSPWGLRIVVAPDAKSPAIHAEPAFLKGQVEIQDEGSQLAALLARRQAGRAGDRSVRRRRRQDARARRRDGKSRADLRDRHRQAPPRADPRAARARRRAQRAGRHAARRQGRARRPRSRPTSC